MHARYLRKLNLQACDLSVYLSTDLSRDLHAPGHRRADPADREVTPLRYTNFMGIQYSDIRDRLDDEALELFGQMVEAHLEAGRGEKLFLRSDSLGGNGLIFSSDQVRRDWRGFNGGALDDLVGYGLLHLGFGGRGNKNYRVSAEGLAFYKWLRREQGQPIEQVSAAVIELVDSPGFATRQPDAAHHLGEAFELLRADDLNDQRMSELGDHLRKAVMDSATAVLGDGANPEQPAKRLRNWLGNHDGLQAREQVMLTRLVDLVEATIEEDHRINHVRDELSRDRARPDYEEVRRAAFMTALVCYEIDRLRGGR